tara:strand:- start:292 stop:813 length:522 start_codon:yes stop_codon:yes gene_type:complete
MKTAIVKWLGYGVFTGIFYIISLFITPLNYFIKEWVRDNNITPLWWFLNDTKPINDKDVDWGDFGRFKHNFWGFYMQNAIRNSHWNLRLLLAPKQGKITDVKYSKKSDKTLTLYRMPNENEEPKFGFQNVSFKMNGKKHFRFSLLKKIKKLIINVQFGVSSRYLYKIRIRKIY